jgi:hypothetical protein
MKNRDSGHTLVTLANAGELVRHITKAVVGDELADTSTLTRDTLLSLAQVKFQNKLSQSLEK